MRDSKFYLYNQAGVEDGPFTETELRKLLVTKKITKGSPVRIEGSLEWQAAIVALNPEMFVQPMPKNLCKKCGAKLPSRHLGCIIPLLFIGIVFATLGYLDPYRGPTMMRSIGFLLIGSSIGSLIWGRTKHVCD